MAHHGSGSSGPPNGGAPAFVGRVPELAAITAALSAPPAVVLIEGEAGIGKTALVREALDAERLRELNVVTTGCPPLPEPFPLGPLVDALHAWPIGELDLSPLAGALRPLFPEWAEQLPPAPEPLDDPRATRYRLFRALAELVERSGVDVLVVEDAHWADTATLEFLVMLATAASRTVSLVVTYRGTDVPAGSPLLWLASRSQSGSSQLRLTLEALDVGEVTRMVASIFATDDISAEFVTFLYERTEGVPLALEETVSLLRDRGDIVRRGGEWSRRALDELEVPPTVRDSILERIGRLSPAARRILEASAVVFEPADEETLVRIADLDGPSAREGVADALTSGLMRESGPGSLVCRHVLTAKAVEDAIPVSDRRRLHHRAARALLEGSTTPVARLSRHFRAAGDVEEWSRHAETAAEMALASGEDRAAVVMLHDLLVAAEHPPDRHARLACALGEAATWGVAALGELASSVTATLRIALARADLPDARRGELRLLLGRLLLQLGDFDAGSVQIEAAAGDLRERPVLAARAMISLAYPRGHAWPLSRHYAWLGEATRLFPEVPPDDRPLLAVDRASVLLMMGDEAGWAAADEVGNEASSLPEQRQTARCLMNAGHAAIGWGRDDEGYRRLDGAVELLGSTGYRRLMNSALLTKAHLEWHGGRWDGLAERVAALAGDEDTLPEALLEARTVTALLDLTSGRRAAAESVLSDVLAEASRHGLVDILVGPAAALGRLCLADETPARALDVTAPAVATITGKDMWVWGADLLPVHVDALVGLGQVGEAQELVESFGAGLGDLRAPAPQAALLVSTGIVAQARAEHNEAARMFADAVEAWSALPRPYNELLAAERQGAVMVATERRDDALDLMMTVQRRLHDLGARWDADRVARGLRAHGMEVARTWRGGRRGYGDQLSPRESEVAALVGRGMTNRQVADELFLSPRTVDRHLGAAMRKLGVSSRTALAVALVGADASGTGSRGTGSGRTGAGGADENIG